MLNENIIYLPFPSFMKSAQHLSLPHLLRQRTLSLNILSIIQPTRIPESYQSKRTLTNRRTVGMWNGYHACLALFGFSVCREIKRRSYPEPLSSIFENIVLRNVLVYPTWFSSPEIEKVNAGHQTALTVLDPAYYTPLFGDARHPLYWPEPFVPVNPFHNILEKYDAC